MQDKTEKLRRLALVARRYYLEDKKQSDIAAELGVSRPLISRMLSEARELGVVEITIHAPGETAEALLRRLSETTSLHGGALAPDGEDDGQTNLALCRETLRLLERLGARRVGIGWGHFIGQMVSLVEAEPPGRSGVEHLFPLLGNAGFPIRNYHSNENVRILASALGAEPHFLYLPALAESCEEKEVLCATELYRQMEQQWRQMDTALVNIGNYPSTPDFASVARYGPLLQRQKACGRLLAYFFNESGQIIRSNHDFAIQLPVEQLAQCRNVVGLCSANTSVRALRGALRTGLFTHLVAREQLVAELLGQK